MEFGVGSHHGPDDVTTGSADVQREVDALGVEHGGDVEGGGA